MQTKANQSVPIEKLNADNYQVSKGEEKYYHARIEVKKFDANTGTRQSIPRVQKFGSKGWKTTLMNLKKQGYSVDVLHDPAKWLSEQQQNAQQSVADREAAKKEQAQKQAEAKAKEEAAEREALKKAIRDEIKAELLAEMKTEAKAATKGADKSVKETEKQAEVKAEAKTTEAKK